MLSNVLKHAGLFLLGMITVIISVTLTMNNKNANKTVVFENIKQFKDNFTKRNEPKNRSSNLETPYFEQGTRVPLHAHFVYGLWDTKPMPENFVNTISRWEEQGWKTRVWNRQEVEALVRRQDHHFHGLASLYFGLGRKVQQADLARYLIVYEQGGFYFDLDCVPEKSEPSLKNFMVDQARDLTGVFFIEMVMPKQWALSTAKRFPIRNGINEDPERLANFAFGCSQGHPALEAVVDTVLKRCRENAVKNLDDYGVLYTTGPDAVTDSLHNLQKDMQETFQLLDHKRFMKHLTTGTWRNGQDK